MKWVRSVWSWVVVFGVLGLLGSGRGAIAMLIPDAEAKAVFASSPGAVIIENYVGYGPGPVWCEADEPPGPEVRAEENVWFRLVVTNSGGEVLNDIVLADSDYPVLPCSAPAELAPGDSFTCDLGPRTAVTGQQENLATVTAQCGADVCQDADYAYYFGLPPFIPTALSILPSSFVLGVGESVAFHAVAQDAAGDTRDVTDRTLFAIDPQAGGAWNGNVYSGGVPGTWTVSARYKDLDASTTLHTVRFKVYLPLVWRN